MKRGIAIFMVVLLGSLAFSVQAAQFEYKLAHVYAPEHPFAQGMDRLAEEVKARTNGEFVIKTYPAAQLGSEKDISDGVVNGIIEMAIVGPGEIGKRYKPVLIFDGPFVFRGYEHAMQVMQSEVGQELWGELENKTGMKNLTTLYYGTRYVTSKKPIKTPEDMKGMKLRAPDMPLSVANAKAMGANPTPMALSEVYLALQQGVVDGQENPVPTIYTQKFHEVQDYIILTGHVVQLTPVFIAKKKFEALPEDFQKALIESVNSIAPEINQDVLNYEKEKLEEMKTSGMNVIEPDVEAFRQATMSVIKEFEETWGKGLYEKIQAIQ
ncbi:MAG: sialic acid TRAP transporter substrate-binding protein SiaP [Candidatus Vecturithrix sp.]|jgi:tripartite ATP-independent transporter DctP family solute receptor|nr:sialic acid TRAP transporter substrate-binding protein SiaP [Candidatus Vecturithrix sp.]